MILHIFSDAPYSQKFIEFINEEYDVKDHQFIILYSNDKSKFINFYQQQSNCIATKNKNIFLNYKDKFKNADKIIIHQLNKPIMMLSLLLFHQKAFKKMTWITWGGDVYFYKYKTNSLKDNLLEILRKITISKIPIIASYIKGDYDKLVEVYNTNAKYMKVKYPTPVDIELIKNTNLKYVNSQTISILVGNSADPSNEHINTYNLLSKFKNKDIKIYSVLSYGGNKNYIEDVIAKGKEIFQDNYNPILDYMKYEDYLKFILDSDICIFNHKRQQGLGNQIIFFALKKKVYISDTTTPFSYYQNLGIDINSTENICKESFEDFIYQDKVKKEESRDIILKDINIETIKQEWKDIFDA
jgi:dTDP-N-acetylfucosamine:lipid II N-acetylfucosaminyltransferase